MAPKAKSVKGPLTYHTSFVILVSYASVGSQCPQETTETCDCDLWGGGGRGKYAYFIHRFSSIKPPICKHMEYLKEKQILCISQASTDSFVVIIHKTNFYHLQTDRTQIFQCLLWLPKKYIQNIGVTTKTNNAWRATLITNGVHDHILQTLHNLRHGVEQLSRPPSFLFWGSVFFLGTW